MNSIRRLAPTLFLFIVDNNPQKINRSFGPTNFAVDNSTSMFLLAGMLFLFGLQAYDRMPKESFPEIVIPTIFVGTTYAGNSAADMENLVTRRLEKEIASITGIKKLESTSIADFSNLIVEFNTGISVDKALREVKDAVDKAKSAPDFPKDLTSGPNIFEINFSEFPIMTVNLSGRYSEDELRKYAEYLQDEIEKVSEISEVKIKGISKREVKVDMDWAAMQSREVSFGDVLNAIGSENITMSAGERLSGGLRRSVRVVGEFKSVREIENLIVKSEFQNAIFLRDIANVYEAFADPTSVARSDGLPVVSLDVIKRSGENLISAADKIKDIVETAKVKRFPSDLKVSIFNDQSIQTKDQVASLQNNILSGMVLVVLVLLFFLGLRTALFVGMAIPMSMLLGILILNVMGISLNMVVLFSLILALGMLVDNSIVTVENTYRYLQEGLQPEEAAKRATGEVAVAVISSTATTVAAFLPLMFWPGLMGEFMKYLPLTLIITLSSSLFVALVLTPPFMAKLMKAKTDNGGVLRAGKDLRKRALLNKLLFLGAMLLLCAFSYMSGARTWGNVFAIMSVLVLTNWLILEPGTRFFQNYFLPALENAYDRFVRFALRGFMPVVFFFGTFGLLFLSLALLTGNPPKVVFFPSADPQYVNAFLELPIGSDIRVTDDIMRQLETRVQKAIEPYESKGIVEAVLSQVGENTADPAGPPEPGATPHKARLTVSFVPSDKRQGISTFDVMEEIRASVQGIPGVEIVVDKNQDGPPTGKPINLEISGDDVEMNQLSVTAEKILNYLQNANVAGVEELKMNITPNVPQDVVRIDREAARRYGLSTYDVASALRTSLYGTEASKFKVGEDEYPIMVRFKEEYRQDQDKLLNQMITFRNMAAGGRIVQIPVSAVASISAGTTYNAIKRKGERRTITIYSNVLGEYNPNEVVDQLKGLMAAYDMPDGYSYKFTGEQEEQAQAMDFLGSAFTIALFLVFLIIVTQFNSILAPLIIMFSILFSTIGVFLGYALTGMDFVIIMTGIGIISLAGVVVNNAIVLLDYAGFLQEQKRAELGRELEPDEVKESIVRSGKTRLRPVLLTAVTTILGLIPLAVGFNFDFGGFITEFNPNIYWGGDNAAFWGALSWTVVFGLAFATFLTLVVVPVMYWILYRSTKIAQNLFAWLGKIMR